MSAIAMNVNESAIQALSFDELDLVAGGEPQALHNQVQIVVADPDGREVVGHAQGETGGGRFHAGNGLEPQLVDVLGEKALKVVLYGFPKRAGGGR